MPDLHDIMNIFADGADSKGGDYPRMPSIDSIIGPDVKWVDHGRYHHAKDTKPLVGFEWHYGGNEMDRWWAMRKPGMKYVPGFGPYASGYYTVHDWDYAGYTMKSGLWGEQDPVDGAEAEEVEKPFLEALKKLSDVIPESLSALDAGKSGTFDWAPTEALISNLLMLSLLFEEHGEGADSNGTLVTAFKALDIPEGPMTGAAASMFGAKIFHLYTRFKDMEDQIRNNYDAIKNIKSAISETATDLRKEVHDTAGESKYSMRAVLDDWYFNESIGRQKWDHGTGQFWIKITESSWGPVSNPTTDENVNNRLKEKWKENYKGVIEKANDLYDRLNEAYSDANRKLKVIEPPTGRTPLSMVPDPESINNPGGPDMPDIPDEIDFKFDDDIFDKIGDGGPDIPDWMREPPPIGGPEGGLGGPEGGPEIDYEIPGGGGDVPTPESPPFVPGSPPPGLPSGLALGPNSPAPPAFDSGTGAPPPPVGSVNPPGFVPGAPLPPLPTPAAGSEGPPGFVPGAPLPPLPTPGAPGSGAGSSSRTNFPPPTALDMDPQTGLPINPETGRPFPIDPDTGIPFVPGTDLPLHVDPETGSVLPIDPVTGLPVQDGGTRLDMDPQTGLPINPETGRPFPIDPDTGIPFVPGTDLPLQYDPVTGQVAPIDPITGSPTTPLPTYPSPTDLPPLPESVYENPATNEPAEINPRTGLPYQIDPETGEAIKGERPPPEFAAPPPGPINSSLPFREGPAPLDLNYGGVNTPPPTSSSDPGGVDSGNSGAGYGSAPGAGGTQMQAGGEPGGFGGNAPAGTHAGMPGGGMPMMPPMGGMGGMGGGGGGGDNGRERNRTTWLSEDEKVWGTDKTRGKAVLGRPVPGEKKGTTRHEFVDAGADGSRTGTSSNDDARNRGRKRKPGVGNRRGNGQEQTRDGDGRRDRSSD